MYEETRPGSQGKTNHQSHGTDQKRLSLNFADDITARRAHRFQNPDLARALSDCGMHRQHDHQRADDRRERDQNPQEDSQTWNRALDTRKDVARKLNLITGKFLVNSPGHRNLIVGILYFYQDIGALAGRLERILQARERQLGARAGFRRIDPDDPVHLFAKYL